MKGMSETSSMKGKYVISFYIGIHYLGYAILNVESNVLKFGLFGIDKNINKMDNSVMTTLRNLVLGLTRVVRDFIAKLFNEWNDKDNESNDANNDSEILNNSKVTKDIKVIIERQVTNNVVAMEVMHLITATCMQYCDNIVIFDPKIKFTTLRPNYNTFNKYIRNSQLWLS